MNEHTPRHIPHSQKSSDRSFGIVFSTFFAIMALFPLLHEHRIRLWLLILSALFLLVALLRASFLGPLNFVWTKFGIVLHGIVSPIALSILFFLVVTPIGMLMRLLVKNPLALRFDRSASSYWIKRIPSGPDPASLKNQF